MRLLAEVLVCVNILKNTMSAKKELCAKCIGSGELVDRKGRVKVCTLCGGIGETEIINNSAYVSEHLYDE